MTLWLANFAADRSAGAALGRLYLTPFHVWCRIAVLLAIAGTLLTNPLDNLVWGATNGTFGFPILLNSSACALTLALAYRRLISQNQRVQDECASIPGALTTLKRRAIAQAFILSSVLGMAMSWFEKLESALPYLSTLHSRALHSLVLAIVFPTYLAIALVASRLPSIIGTIIITLTSCHLVAALAPPLIALTEASIGSRLHESSSAVVVLVHLPFLVICRYRIWKADLARAGPENQ